MVAAGTSDSRYFRAKGITTYGVLPFKITQGQVREQIRRWYASKWLAPNALKSRALVDRLHGVYIPYWTFDALVDAESFFEIKPLFAPELITGLARLDGRPVDDLAWFDALGRYKMAAIMGHNLRRHLEGRHHDPDQERLPDTIQRLIATGLSTTF